ncbi:hypothetical protein PINS_up006295 [Pythium insidiosum]|nr:hypothetical protein PINS_up006295 [Pythium insidiosum]
MQSELSQLDSCVLAYLKMISDEVFTKGLTNPLRFPVVAQHLTQCLLSPNPTPSQLIKKLLAHSSQSKSSTELSSSPLESYLIAVHRNTEAFLRGSLTLLQSMRLYDFAAAIALPFVKKSIFAWTKIFEMLGNNIRRTLTESSNEAIPSGPNHTSSKDSSSSGLQKLPTLIGDFVLALLSQLYESQERPRTGVTDESVAIQFLEFGTSFWRFWAADKDSLAGSRRYSGLIAPLLRCIEFASDGEKRRASLFLKMILELFLSSGTSVDPALLSRVDESSKKPTFTIDSKLKTELTRMTTKLREVKKTSRFFSVRPTPKTQGGLSRASASSSKTIIDLTRSSGAVKARSTPMSEQISQMQEMEQGRRAMSGKAAAREQARLAMERSAATTIYEVSQKKDHSFYSNDDIISKTTTKRPSSTARTEGGSKQAFSISQVISDLPLSRQASRYQQELAKDRDNRTVVEVKEEEEEEDDDENTFNLAALFYKIKNTQKAIPTCSLLPFYRHLLQLCMPALLMKEFESERSDRELQAPGLTFERCSEYVQAFLPLLLEECHNEVQEGLRRSYFANSNTGHLLRYESERTREGMRCINFSIVEAQPSPGDKGKADRFRREKLFRNADVVFLRSSGARHHGGTLEFIGVILVTDNDRGKRKQRSGPSGENGASEDEMVRVLFLNDGELESVTSDVASFKMEAFTAAAIGDSEWRVSTLCNLVTSSREYIALRSVDMFPEHLRTTILTPNMYKSLQSELLTITSVLDELRHVKSVDSITKITKLLRRLDKMDVTLTELRVSIVFFSLLQMSRQS